MVPEPDDDEQPTRALILKAIRDEPGRSAQDIARQLQLAWGTIVYHVRILDKQSRIAIVHPGRGMRLFPSDVPEEHRSWLAAMCDTAGAKVLAAVAKNPGRRVPYLSKQLQVGQRLVRRHLLRLQGEHLIERDAGSRGGYRTDAPEWARKRLERLLQEPDPIVQFDGLPSDDEGAPPAQPRNPLLLGPKL